MLRISAKTGESVADVLDAVVERITAPEGPGRSASRARVRLSYDQYRGVAFVRVVDGRFRTRDDLRAAGRDAGSRGRGSWLSSPGQCARRPRHSRPEVRRHADAGRLRVKDTPHERAPRCIEPLPGYKDAADGLAGLYPTDSDDYPELRDALEKLKLNDASSSTSPRPRRRWVSGSAAVPRLLHMEIVRERLERDLDLLVTAPNVAYRVRRAGWGGDRGAQPGRHAAGVRARRGIYPRDDDRPEGVRRLRHGAE